MNSNIKLFRTCFLFISLALSTSAIGQEKTVRAAPSLKLWYQQPAGEVWENALPIGNGWQGAMVYGNVEQETIQLNEHTIWSGSPNRNDTPVPPDSLALIRQLIFDGRNKEAEQLANRLMFHKKSSGQMFQPAGNLVLDFAGHGDYSNYRRELDIERAVATTTYTVGDVTYTRQSIASLPDRVIAIRLTASRPGTLSFTASYNTQHPNADIATAEDGLLTFAGITKDHEGVKGMVRYKGLIHVKNDGGTRRTENDRLVVNGADAATIFISIATNFNNYHDINGDENARAEALLANVQQKSFEGILSSHVAAYQQYFNRVAFDLGTTEAAYLPTDVRLANFRKTFDPHFVVLYYQFGRYLLISSSQPGGQPANLQGIWNHRMDPAWDSKYTININAEMNYWPAERTNLAELHEPFLRLVKEMSETGERTAATMYGTRGWVAHHNTDIWRITGPVDGPNWGLWPSGSAWTSQHLWEHYLYNGDEQYLASIYPVLRGASTFYVDFLVEHPQHEWLVINPGNSPENAPEAYGGTTLTAGATMDNQLVFDIFSVTIRAAEILGKDAAFRDTLAQLRDRLPPMQIGQYGQLQEWLEDLDRPDDQHRHISHLYGLFPSNQISAYRTPKLFNAARTTLLHRGDVSTGWSMGWKVNWWARMQDGNHAYKLIRDQLTPVGEGGSGGTYNNLFDAHPPFQIDGNFGCTSGITEMLMQTADGAIHILPALPTMWTEGSISGLRAWGGFEIEEISWKDSKLEKIVVRSNLGGNLRLRVPSQLKADKGLKISAASGENLNPFFFLEDTKEPLLSPHYPGDAPIRLEETWVYDIGTQKGETYVFHAEKL